MGVEHRPVLIFAILPTGHGAREHSLYWAQPSYCRGSVIVLLLLWSSICYHRPVLITNTHLFRVLGQDPHNIASSQAWTEHYTVGCCSILSHRRGLWKPNSILPWRERHPRAEPQFRANWSIHPSPSSTFRSPDHYLSHPTYLIAASPGNLRESSLVSHNLSHLCGIFQPTKQLDSSLSVRIPLPRIH